MPALILSDLSSLKIKTEISEGDLKNIYLGQKATVKIPSLTFTTESKIVAIIPNSNPMTHTFSVKLSFVHPKDLSIYPGMYATVFIKTP